MPNEPATPAPCPTCGRPSQQAFRPFCSRRCADVDLGNWLTGRYVVPGDPELEEDEARPVAPKTPDDD